MHDPTEAAFLRSIAESDDTVHRLVLADWLEERGETARADFLRVQCELAAPGIAEERRIALGVRERVLLDAHRQKWLQGFGLPIEDVDFQGGLIARMRLARWDDGKWLAAEHQARLSTLTELDLSGLGIGDAGLALFAKAANFPALHKLVLSDNNIAQAGVTALAKAPGLPKLDTVYLFQNPASHGAAAWAARTALENAPHFCLGNLDIGERAEGYCMSPGQAEVARRLHVRTHLLPVVSQYFQTYERLQSAMLCVAQYWADEADDAVHGVLIVSERLAPILEGAEWGWGEGTKPDINLPNTRIQGKHGESGSVIGLWGSPWDDNSGAIPLWAAFAPEGGSQEYDNVGEVYAPAVMFYRHGGYEFLPMCRPHLDGIQPEWGWEE